MDQSDEKKRDEVLKRMLETPPQPKSGKQEKAGGRTHPRAPDGSIDSEGAPRDC